VPCTAPRCNIAVCLICICCANSHDEVMCYNEQGSSKWQFSYYTIKRRFMLFFVLQTKNSHIGCILMHSIIAGQLVLSVPKFQPAHKCRQNFFNHGLQSVYHSFRVWKMSQLEHLTNIRFFQHLDISTSTCKIPEMMCQNSYYAITSTGLERCNPYQNIPMHSLEILNATQYRLVQSGKIASDGCSAGQGSSEL
jgi:hypothetical protein